MIGALVTLASTAPAWWLLAASAGAAGRAVQMTLQLSRSLIAANGASTTTATATVTDASGNGVPGQLIYLGSSDGRGWLMSHSTKGVYTVTITSSITPGALVLTAHDLAGTPPPAHVTLVQYGSASSVWVVLSPPVILADNTSLATATATVTDASGDPVPADNVRFSSSDPGQTPGATTNHGDGTYSALIRGSATPGNAIITATDRTAGISGQATLTQVSNSSTTKLVASPSSVVTNQAVFLLAAISSSAGSASGTITFGANGASIPGCGPLSVTPGSPVAVCQTSFSALTSPEQLMAVFTPDSSSTVAGSADAIPLSVGSDSTSTLVSASSSPVTVGGSVTYTASISPGHQGPRQPSGSVVFQDGGKPIGSCASQPLATVSGSLAATCTVRYLRIGQHSISAAYQGDADFSGSSSNILHVRVQVRGTIASTMQWSFRFSPSHTAVQALLVNGAPFGTTVSMSCNGRGCPFAERAIVLSKTKRCPQKRGVCRGPRKGTVNLTPAFRNDRLRVGARIAVAITRTGWIGKHYVFVTRAGKGPRVWIACLAPGAARPGVGC